MSPIDYLRDMVNRGRKPATGGVIHPNQAPPIVEPVGYLVPTAAAKPAEAMPSGFIKFSGTVSEADVEQIRQQLQVMPRMRAPRSEPLRCPCVAIYSECRCPGTNIRAQTNTADFRHDQR